MLVIGMKSAFCQQVKGEKAYGSLEWLND